jgi:hypothetical protein
VNEPQANYFALPAFTLWWREMVRFFRQRDRVVGALLTPVCFWLLLGFGLGNSFKTRGSWVFGVFFRRHVGDDLVVHGDFLNHLGH